ncbi:class I SAM-dependent methyltransferase [Magnetovibrio sp. PR-2]|uniref:class I SAM-dependent methyltransferase n=1 Tax=Magnetovibrio sp. PR-2 TaxID=3120356 RepID=UPI002FCE1BBD
MRADYSTIVDASASEEEKLDKHWTDNWESIGNQRRAQWKIKMGPEFAVVDRFAPKPQPGGSLMRVLDGGCGLGEWCLLLKDMGFEPHGLDISTPTVEALTQEFPDMHFVRDDIRNTSFADNHFDLYISWGTFEHFENGLQDCFAEALRVIKPGGKLIITVPFYNTRLKKIDGGVLPQKGENTEFYQWRLEQDELRQEFEKGGFTCDRIEPIYTREGLNRHLHHRYGLPYGRLTSLLAMGLSAVMPAKTFAHMLIGVGTKPQT